MAHTVTHNSFDRSLIGAFAATPMLVSSHDNKDFVGPSLGRLLTTYCVVLGALSFNFLLAMINARFFATGENLVIASEMVLVMVGLGLAISRRIAMPLIGLVFVSYLFVLMALRPEFDQKAVRDFLVPLIFYFVGRNFADARQLDRIVLLSALFIVAVGAVEFILPQLYVSVVEPIKYYIVRGSLDEANLTQFSKDTGLFASSSRYGARIFLGSFLPDYRASSIFLEPVSLGNFGVIIYMWALFRKAMGGRLLLLGLAAAIIILADARFGMFGCAIATLTMVFAPLISRHLLFALPFIFLGGLFAYGQYSVAVLWEDDFAGRILWSAQIADALTWAQILGVSVKNSFVADNGYAYALTQFGILGVVFLWALIVYSAGPNRRAWHFRLTLGVYLAVNLCISNSAFSIKTSALLFVMLGVSDCLVRTRQKRA